MRKALVFAAGIALAVAMTGPVSTDSSHSDAHYYRKAVAALKETEEQIDKVEHNHKGYKSSARDHVRKALEYAEKGLHHAEKTKPNPHPRRRSRHCDRVPRSVRPMLS